MRIAIITAMEEEMAPFRSESRIQARSQVGKVIVEEAIYRDQPIILVESGIGKVNAAVAVTLLIERYKPDLIINSGSSGAFADGLKVGDVVVATQYRYGDVDATCFGYEHGQVPQMPVKYDLDEEWVDVARQAAAVADKLPYSLDFGLVLTLDSFMSESERVEWIKSTFPSVKVSDMEGLAIVQAAAQYGIPVLAIKAVSDITGHGGDTADSFDDNLDDVAKHAAHFTELLVQQIQSSAVQL
ncbi:5'-methylthioadenosine/adenosylhomocysteine nucleosidase [Paenibacillus donghaensis]|uniref:5'-methylthioadenosine/adenosylhomocysteine nucleosidase n=1 Tax=Paenibacillus donghaensis TaxID=414771 RepID=UPI0018841E03|nr:5'-methylthioadenosine/adenosylhomocysteine nucleosidase [Paenibacillus donghaensis]MBE9914131.1 5'-methylthioadenosine/adenosylhomocysteine nucleosidase [Paenibacillus donghaensis]